ncbi:NUDIX domain-containing protein [Sporosarcina sp. Marseille-Q4063]|uniref:NUDIX hydrolase n=1 Tax=Sporosarcina sp. Marseille-Q4063 TaxID=2810514 RepID=UPI001BAE874A|nr:NUDIX domain-containing protein [Sporosarcina sp. Marseille-Q4063]QUW23589.1 NUDIX domain-containing protein [Sporosarcina sp. Marseille-Q4063]
MIIVNVEGAIYKNGKWLLIERSLKEEHAGGTLSLVGGKVEFEGDSSDILERTLEREILEEVGIKVKDLEYVNSSSFVTDSGLNVVDIVFLCEHESGEAYAKSPDEVDGVIWFSTDQIISHSELPVYLKRNIELAELSLRRRLSLK